MTPETLVTELRQSPFNQSFYETTCEVKRFLDNFMFYTQGEGKDLTKFFDAIPAFQRDNDKWTTAMQVAFVENVLRGCRTNILLYEVVDEKETPLRAYCRVIDGYQRLTALYRFVTGEIKCFGLTFDEMDESRVLVRVRPSFNFRIYSFSSEIEAVEFYIAMNEHITHSPQDIAKARAYLEDLKAGRVIVTAQDFIRDLA